MFMTDYKVCLALTPPEPRKAHLKLFELMGDEFGFEVRRSVDHRDRANDILQASFLIADLSGNDPGVLYDLGVAHTFGKRVFLVTDQLDTLAFDLASNRTWVIDSSAGNQEIHRAMEQFLSTRQTIGPVRLLLGKYAFFGENLIVRRFGAFLIDIMLIVSLLIVVFLVFTPAGYDTVMGKIDFVIGQLKTSGGDAANFVETVLVSALYLFAGYLAVFTWIFGATVGQLLMGIRVVQADYRRASFGQAIGRTVLLYLVLITFGAAFLSAMVGPGYRAVHDILSGTIVVRRHPL